MAQCKYCHREAEEDMGICLWCEEQIWDARMEAQEERQRHKDYDEEGVD